MRDPLDKIRLIATIKDGGSQLIEFNGIRYFIDRGIGSPTKGKIFHNDRDGRIIKGEELTQIKVAIINSSEIF